MSLQLSAATKEASTLATANANLVGHQNQRQKIQLHVKIKEENNQLKRREFALVQEVSSFSGTSCVVIYKVVFIA
jgi:hypothetical protein